MDGGVSETETEAVGRAIHIADPALWYVELNDDTDIESRQSRVTLFPADPNADGMPSTREAH